MLLMLNRTMTLNATAEALGTYGREDREWRVDISPKFRSMR